ncbi:MAG: hypothetical protein ACI4RN_07760 [Oscillospiraceae bacterium]
MEAPKQEKAVPSVEVVESKQKPVENKTPIKQKVKQQSTKSEAVNTIPKEVAKNSEFDLSCLKEGILVIHKMFGIGTVIKVDKVQERITVKFNKGEKVFIIPTVFETGFLKLK